MNNLAYFYRWYEPKTRTLKKGGELKREKDYFSSIKQLAINDYWAAALTDGKCYLHPIEEVPGNGHDLEKYLFYKGYIKFYVGDSHQLKMRNRLVTLV